MRYRRDDGALWRRHGHHVLALPEGRQETILLAETGPALWRALAEPRSIEELAELLAAELGAEAEGIDDGITTAVRTAVDELRSVGLVSEAR